MLLLLFLPLCHISRSENDGIQKNSMYVCAIYVGSVVQGVFAVSFVLFVFRISISKQRHTRLCWVLMVPQLARFAVLSFVSKYCTFGVCAVTP